MKFIFLIFCIILSTICYGQNKKILVEDCDSFMYSYHKKFIAKHKLPDLKSTPDSIYIRIRVNTISTHNHLYELRFDGTNWNGRIISYGAADYYRFACFFVLFNNPHVIKSRKTKSLVVLYEKKINPLNGDSILKWDAIQNDLFGIAGIRTQELVDTSKIGIDDGVWYDIEFSTPTTYKYISWSNPKYASVSNSSKAILRLEGLFEHVIVPDEEELWKLVKKHKWAK